MMTWTTLFNRACRLLAPLFLLLAFGQPAQAAPCATNCVTAGDFTVATLSQGIVRTYLVHVPASYKGDKAVPLVLDLHGVLSYSDEQRRRSGQLQQSDKRGFIVVWPQGVGLSWRAYGCCFVADAANVDDVAFLRSVIVVMKSRANIDATRVFVTGLSNGAAMAQRMACESADLVRAVAAVSFPLNTDRCTPAKPIGVTELAGTADTTVPYDGKPSVPPLPDDIAGVPIGLQGARQSLAAWKRIDGCSDDLTRTQLPAGSRDETYFTCRGGVKVGLVTVAGGEHVLYNDPNGTGNPADDKLPFNIAEYIWDHVFNL